MMEKEKREKAGREAKPIRRGTGKMVMGIRFWKKRKKAKFGWRGLRSVVGVVNGWQRVALSA